MRRTCFNCGRSAATMDHIPPKCLFRKNSKLQLISVPACRECNESTALDDEYFCAALATMWTTSPAPQEVWAQRFRRQIRRPNFQGLRKLLASQTKPIWLPTNRGFTLTGIVAADQERMDRSIQKIVRGLYYHHREKQMPTDTVIDVLWKPSEWMPNVAYRCPLVVVEADTFAYRYGLAANEPEVSAWWLAFYNSLLILALVAPPAFREQALRQAAEP